MSKRRILVVEDDPSIRRGMVDALSFAGHEVLEAGRGDLGLELALTKHPDLLLLDLVLPGAGGWEVLEAVQRECPGLPVIILTAKGGEDDRVRGLRKGADDYVVKPFSVKELLARIEAVLRRSPERSKEDRVVCCPAGRVDLARRCVASADGSEAALTEREFELLRHLVAHAGRPVSREEILWRVWKLDPRQVETRAMDMTVLRLREKLGDGDGRHVRTIRGQGYQWTPPEGGP